MKYFILTIVILSSSYFAKAQYEEDSLKFYNNNLNDTVTLNKLINYCFNKKAVMPDLAFTYSQIALAKSKQLGSKYCEARSLTNLGSIEANRSNYASALNYYLQTLAINEQQYFAKGVLLSKNNIAEVYGYLKKPTLQFQFLKEAESIAIQNNFEEELGLIKTNMSIYYSNTGNFRNAFNEQIKAIPINEKYNKLSEAASGYSNAGAYLFYLNKMDSAILYYKYAKTIGDKINDQKVIAMSWANIAEAYTTKGLIDTAIHYYEKSIAIAKPHDLKDILSFSYEQLAVIYTKNKDYEKALTFTSLKQNVKDSILNTTVTKQITEAETKYETAKKEQQILQQRLAITQKNYWIATIFGLLLLVSFVFYNYNKNKMAKQKAQLELTQMQAVLDGEEKERTRIAKDLHDGIVQDLTVIKLQLNAGMCDDIINKKFVANAVDAIDQASKEVRNISYQMMPATLLQLGLIPALDDLLKRVLAPNKIDYDFEHIGVDERLPENIEVSIFRISQELINNVLKHSEANFVSLLITIKANIITMIFEDNGKGFDVATIKKGVGFSSLSSRVELLNGDIKYEKAEGVGTTAIVKIPIVN